MQGAPSKGRVLRSFSDEVTGPSAFGARRGARNPLHQSNGKGVLRKRIGCNAQNAANGRSFGDYLQRHRPPEAADAQGALIYAEDSLGKGH